MAAKNRKPTDGPDDEELLEAITGREPPEDSYAADRSPRPRGSASQTGVLQSMGGTRRGPVRAAGKGTPSLDKDGLIDFIFHHVNTWLDRFLEQVKAGEGAA